MTAEGHLPSGHRLRMAGLLLRAGGVVAHPTEGVWGLACTPFDGDAAARVIALKGRSPRAGFIVLAARVAAVEPLLASGGDPARWGEVTAGWPGAKTWILTAAPGLPDWLTGGRDTLAVRVTAHALSAALCEAAGGLLVSTSANRSGRRPARDALAVRRHFGDGVDMILAGPTGGRAGPTPIHDARTGRMLRA